MNAMRSFTHVSFIARPTEDVLRSKAAWASLSLLLATELEIT
jgi:hypothetical protein